MTDPEKLERENRKHYDSIVIKVLLAPIYFTRIHLSTFFLNEREVSPDSDLNQADVTISAPTHTHLG